MENFKDLESFSYPGRVVQFTKVNQNEKVMHMLILQKTFMTVPLHISVLKDDP